MEDGLKEAVGTQVVIVVIGVDSSDGVMDFRRGFAVDGLDDL